MPSPDARLSRTTTPARSIDTDADALLQTLIETPLVAGYERRGPVALRSITTQHHFKPRRAAAHSWFDTLLLRSSQVLLVGAVLMLGYWFVNVPMNNWLYNRRAPTVRAAGAVPSAAAMRVAPTKTPVPVASAAPAIHEPAPQNDRRVPPQRASAVPITAGSAAQTSAPHATRPLTVGQQIRLPALAADVFPSATIPQPTAAPLRPSPTTTLFWPTITPVQLGTVSKPSPLPAPTKVTIAQPGAASQPSGVSTLPTRLSIPAIGLDVPIIEVFIVGNQWQVAEYAAGYLNGSGRPGRPGNLALEGHAGLYGAVFANMGALNPGDDIYIDAAGLRYHYRMRESKVVWPNQIEVLDSTETPTMSLITCTNWDTQRLVAVADFVDSSPLLDA